MTWGASPSLGEIYGSKKNRFRWLSDFQGVSDVLQVWISDLPRSVSLGSSTSKLRMCFMEAGKTDFDAIMTITGHRFSRWVLVLVLSNLLIIVVVGNLWVIPLSKWTYCTVLRGSWLVWWVLEQGVSLRRKAVGLTSFLSFSWVTLVGVKWKKKQKQKQKKLGNQNEMKFLKIAFTCLDRRKWNKWKFCFLCVQLEGK